MGISYTIQLLLHRPLIGIGIGIAPPPCVFPALHQGRRAVAPPTHSIAFVQISLVSSFLKAWEKINTRC
jgi:hypothetical protein